MPIATGTSLKGRQVLIGGSGSLGRCVYGALREMGVKDILIVDRSPPNEKFVKCYGLEDGETVQYRKHQLAKDSVRQLADILEGAEVVYTMIMPDLLKGQEDMYYQANYIGMEEVVDACEMAKVQRLVHASSIAVTNHFVESFNASESDPLPPFSEYSSCYDISKRLGEDVILKAQNVSTCSVRFGGLLISPYDYLCRDIFDSDTLYALKGADIDIIGGRDAAIAMIKAAERLGNPDHPICGKALFFTHAKAGGIPVQHNNVMPIAATLLKKKKVVFITPLVLYIMALVFFLKDFFDRYILRKSDVLGVPLHRFLLICRYQKTFDNSKAYELLEYKPQDTLEDAFKRVFADYETMNNVTLPKFYSS